MGQCCPPKEVHVAVCKPFKKNVSVCLTGVDKQISICKEQNQQIQLEKRLVKNISVCGNHSSPAPIDALTLGWSGHPAYSLVDNEYIQFTAPNSNGDRHFTCDALDSLQDYEIYADFVTFGDADNEPRICGIRVLIGGVDLRNFRYYPNLGTNGDFVYVDPAITQLEGTMNLAPGQLFSMKFRKIGTTIDFNCWIPSVRSEPDYGVGEYAFTEVITDEIGKVGVSSNYGFSDWRCTKFNVQEL